MAEGIMTLDIMFVCGSRNFPTADRVQINQRLDAWLAEVKSLNHVPLTLQGGAGGPDRWLGEWSEERGVQPILMNALWDANGRSAGHQRNRQMGNVLRVLSAGGATCRGMALWDGRSPGTKGMIDVWTQVFKVEPLILRPTS